MTNTFKTSGLQLDMVLLMDGVARLARHNGVQMRQLPFVLEIICRLDRKWAANMRLGPS